MNLSQISLINTLEMDLSGTLIKQGAHAGIIRSYNVFFCFYIYKAIRKVLFSPFLTKRSYKGLIFVPKLKFNNRKLSSCNKS